MVSPLPMATRDAEQARDDLAVHGYCVLRDALPAESVAALRTRVVEQSLGERAIGVRAQEDPNAGVYLGGAGLGAHSNRRIWTVVNKGEAFESLLTHPTVLELVGSVIEAPFLLSGIQANFVSPGDDPLPLHSDQGYVPRPWPPYALTASVIWMLDEFTEDNGATTVLPGSHLGAGTASGDVVARAHLLRRGGIPVCAPPGSALVFDGRITHGAGRNSTTRDRLAVLTYFCRPFLRQQENFALSLSPRVLEQLPDDVKRLLGFGVWKTLGSVEGVCAEGAIVGRPEHPVEALAPDGRPLPVQRSPATG